MTENRNDRSNQTTDRMNASPTPDANRQQVTPTEKTEKEVIVAEEEEGEEETTDGDTNTQKDESKTKKDPKVNM
jgi:hypothetical protein